jgi:multidrug resistance protein, MATE family
MNKLTRYQEGSVRELWALSLPLMISVLASLCMIFTDRLFLSRYSLDALNAIANAGTLAWALMGGVGMITAMSEVFVAQYNGAQLYQRIGIPVWQMVWLALISYIIFIPLGLFSSKIFSFSTNGALEAQFFSWMMFFGPSYAIMTAFAGFFIGRGKTKVLIVIAIIANILNILLDWLLIFGAPPYIPEMGVKGAAIATSCGYVFQTGMLAILFFRKRYRIEFGTTQWQFNLVEFKKCFKIGLPQGIFVALEIFGWAVFYWMMTSLSKTHITVSSICQSLWILFSFFGDGLCRGVTATAGNLIGSNRKEILYRVMRSALILHALFICIIASILLIDSKDVIHFLFFEHLDSISDQTTGVNLIETVRICLVLTFINLFFEGARWVFSGLLIAAGDTFFLMITGSLSVWVGLLLPIWAIVLRYQLPVEDAWLTASIYSLILFIVYAIRFKQGAWKKIDLISDDQKEREKGAELVSFGSPKN